MQPLFYPFNALNWLREPELMTRKHVFRKHDCVQYPIQLSTIYMLQNQLVVKKKVTYIDLIIFSLSANFVFCAHRIAPPSAKECNMIKFKKKR